MNLEWAPGRHDAASTITVGRAEVTFQILTNKSDQPTASAVGISRIKSFGRAPRSEHEGKIQLESLILAQNER